jgi:hypothetical protein
MRILNETRAAPVAYSRGRRIEAIVRVRGVDARAGSRGFSYQRHEPQAIILRGEDDIARVAIPGPTMNVAGAVAPVAIYLLSRALVKRRRTP